MSVVMQKLRSFATLPAYENEEKSREAQLAYIIALTFAVAPFFYGVVRLLSNLTDAPLAVLLPAFGVSIVSVVILVLIRQGFVRLGSGLLVSVVWLGLAYLATNLGGVRDSAYAGFIMAIVMAGLLMGWRATLVVVVATLLLGWNLVQAENNGTLIQDADTPAEVLFSYAAFFVMSTGLVTAASRGFQRLLRRIQESERDMRARNWELRQMRDSLESRVVERTADLDRRSRYLEAAAQVAYAAGEILDVDQLMAESVDLIRDVFDLYYVGFFVVDGTRAWAVLRAGTGEAGQRMLARGHRIRVGDGMVGWCIENGESRYAQHAEEDLIRVTSPELPETRAEAALPLRARGRVLGAITVQSSSLDFFDDTVVTVLQTMADLLAVAVNNAELFAESEQAVAAVRRAYGEVAGTAWDELLQARGDWGYRYSQGIVHALQGRQTGAWEPATLRALDEKQPVHDRSAASVAIPLQVAGHVVGAVSYQRRADEGDWEPEDVALLSTLTDQLSQSLDSARLLQETQRQAAREQQINDIAAQLTNATDIESVLRAAAAELGRLPGVLEASAHLELPDAVEDPGTPSVEEPAWRAFVQERRGILGYRHELLGTVPVADHRPEADEALVRGESVLDVLAAGNGASTASGARVGLGVPVRLRNQILGVLNLRFEGSHVPSEMVQLVEQVADRMAVSLEAARLLEETQRAAQRERLIGDLSRRIRESLAVDEVLKDSVREIRQAMDLYRVSVRLSPSLPDGGHGETPAPAGSTPEGGHGETPAPAGGTPEEGHVETPAPAAGIPEEGNSGTSASAGDTPEDAGVGESNGGDL